MRPLRMHFLLILLNKQNLLKSASTYHNSFACCFSIEHLQRVWHDDRGRLLLRTPGPVPLGLADVLLVEINPFPNLSLFFRTMLFEYPSVLSRFCLFPISLKVWLHHYALFYESKVFFLSCATKTSVLHSICCLLWFCTIEVKRYFHKKWWLRTRRTIYRVKF